MYAEFINSLNICSERQISMPFINFENMVQYPRYPL